MSDVLRVGIIGTGVGVRTILPGFRRTGRADVQILSGSSLERAREVGRPLGIPTFTGDYRDVCNNPEVDLICVASPNFFHLEHALAALATDKHVYLEKPTAVDEREARMVAEAAQDRGAITVVGHQLRFNPYLQEMARMVKSGEIGRPYHLSISQRGSGFTNPNRKWTWEFEESSGGGVRLAMGSHLVDLARFILGKDPVAIAASLDPVHLTRHPDTGPPRSCFVSNYFSAQCDFQETATQLVTSAAVHSPPAFDVTVYGEHADLTFSLDGRLQLMRLGRDPDVVLSHDVDDEYRHRMASSIFSTSFTYFAEEIVRAILDDEVSGLLEASTVVDAVTNMQVLDAALRSARQGECVVLGAWPSNSYY